MNELTTKWKILLASMFLGAGTFFTLTLNKMGITLVETKPFFSLFGGFDLQAFTQYLLFNFFGIFTLVLITIFIVHNGLIMPVVTFVCDLFGICDEESQESSEQ